MDAYTSYYLQQAKTGKGSTFYNRQKGRGIGSFIGSIFRTIYPYIKSGFSALRDELLSGGVGFIQDTVNQVPAKESLVNRVRQVGNNLTERAANKVSTMTGSGATNTRKRKRSAQTTTRRVKRKTAKSRTGNRKKKTTIKRLKKNCKNSNKKRKSGQACHKRVKKQRGKGGTYHNDIFS